MKKKLSDLLIKTPKVISECYSTYHLYVIRLETNITKITHTELFNSLRAEGIGVNVHYEPIHLHPFYLKLGFKVGDYPESESFSSQAVSLPIYSSLSEKQQHKVIDVLHKLVESK